MQWISMMIGQKVIFGSIKKPFRHLHRPRTTLFLWTQFSDQKQLHMLKSEKFSKYFLYKIGSNNIFLCDCNHLSFIYDAPKFSTVYVVKSPILGQVSSTSFGISFCLPVQFQIRGHSTTTWTRRGGGGVSQKSTLVHPGGGLECPRGPKFEKIHLF